MAASDREAVKPSLSRVAGSRSHVKQTVKRPIGLKTSVSAGREAARQSPARKLNAK